MEIWKIVHGCSLNLYSRQCAWKSNRPRVANGDQTTPCELLANDFRYPHSDTITKFWADFFQKMRILHLGETNKNAVRTTKF